VFPPDAKDVAWLPRVAADGWVIITKDSRIRTRTLELDALVSSKAIAFILTSGAIRGEQMAAALVRALPKIGRILAGGHRPIIAEVNHLGGVRVLRHGARPARRGRR
jgi:hypothetical protein